MSSQTVGRHRSPARYNPLTELRGVLRDATTPLTRTAATLAATGGLIASVAAPVSAAGQSDSGTNAAAVAAAPAELPVVDLPVDVAAPVAERAAQESLDIDSPLLAVGAPAELPSAKVEDAAVKVEDVAKKAEVAVKAKADAEAKVKAEREVRQQAAQVSRDATRTAINAAPQAPAAQAEPAVAADGSIVGIAASLTGIPYLWGGTSTRGFDCAGYTQYVYANAGKSIPRTANAQQAAATKVTNPQPGDLVFFGSPAYHVGIYAGPGVMYDAQRTGTLTGLHKIWTTPSGYGRF